jgi:hypothetical protein
VPNSVQIIGDTAFIPVDTTGEGDTYEGVVFETYGANPFYRKFYNTLVIVPSTGYSTITYAGEGEPFDSTYLDKEFVLFRGHLNPTTYPTAGVLNGNYWPGLNTCRYSKVTSVIDGHTLIVNFAYNGGSYTPATNSDGSGYFFFDNLAAFKQAIQDTATIVKFKADSTYVVKGGWNEFVNKDFKVYCPDGVAGLKISMEDAFFVERNGFNQDYTTNSFNSTFNSLEFFKLQNNTDYDVEFENINILPPHLNVATSHYGRLPYAFFHHSGTLATLSDFITGIRSIKNCDNQAEASEYPAGTFQGSTIAASNEGGKLNEDQDDLEAYQDFKLVNSTWHGTEVDGIRANKRNGNIWRIVGEEPFVTYATANNRTSKSRYNDTITIGNDGGGKYRKISLEAFSAYQMMNEYTSGSQSHSMDIYANDRRWQYIDMADDAAVTWRLYIANLGSFADDYPAATNYLQYTPLIDGSSFRINEEIPRVGQTAFTT